MYKLSGKREHDDWPERFKYIFIKNTPENICNRYMRMRVCGPSVEKVCYCMQ